MLYSPTTAVVGWMGFHAENSTKLRQLREDDSSSRRSMKLVSGEKKDSIVLRRRPRVPSDEVESRLLSRRDDVRLLTFSFVVARTAAGITTSSSSVSTVSSCFCTSTGSSSSSSSSLMLIKLRGRLIEGRRRPGERPSNAASASDRFRWRVLTETTERNEGAIRRDIEVAGALMGSMIMSIALSPVKGGVGGAERLGENDAKYERASPGESRGEESSEGERMAGSELVERWYEPTPMDEDDEPTSGKHAENVRVRLEGRRRWRGGAGTSGRVVDGAGFGEGRHSVSREPRRSIGEERRLGETKASAGCLRDARGQCTHGIGAAADEAVEGTWKGAYDGAVLDDRKKVSERVRMGP